jgi:hypothetical protein
MDSVNGNNAGWEVGTDADAEPATKRARSRDSLFLIARMRLDGDTTTRDVRVRNLSEGGLMVELDRIVAAGTAVHLDLRGIGEITGTVAWCTEGRLGISLDAPIDPKKARKPVGGAKTSVTPFYAKAVRR